MVDNSSFDTSRKTDQTREDRLKTALKANLARRKAQSRERIKTEQTTDKVPGDPGQDKDA